MSRRTHLSNRRSTLQRKPVFRSVLQNPFQINWPSVPVNVQNITLARLVAALDNVPPRSRASPRFTHESGGSDHQENADTTTTTHTDPSAAGASQWLVIGINTVTRALESHLRLARKHVVLDNLLPDNDQRPPFSAQSPLAVVFVCCADVDPTALIDHIPYLVAGCNSPRNVTEPIKLIPLPKGSEPTISQILSVRRAAIVALRHSSPMLESFQGILDSVPIISAPWLSPLATPRFVPTHIKQLHTTAPMDMKAAREERAKARAAAKKSFSRTMRRKPRLTLTTGSEGAV